MNADESVLGCGENMTASVLFLSTWGLVRGCQGRVGPAALCPLYNPGLGQPLWPCSPVRVTVSVGPALGLPEALYVPLQMVAWVGAPPAPKRGSLHSWSSGLQGYSNISKTYLSLNL